MVGKGARDGGRGRGESGGGVPHREADRVGGLLGGVVGEASPRRRRGGGEGDGTGEAKQEAARQLTLRGLNSPRHQPPKHHLPLRLHAGNILFITCLDFHLHLLFDLI